MQQLPPNLHFPACFTNPKHIPLSFSIYWDYALTVPLRQIVCIHCHQRREYTAAAPPNHPHSHSHVTLHQSAHTKHSVMKGLCFISCCHMKILIACLDKV